MLNSDTIAAISTALGNSGIHIIRISGCNSFNIINNIFKKGKQLQAFDVNNYESHTIHYGYIFDEDVCLDEVMVSIFKSPGSYTTEDIVEINCHGGSYVVKHILKLILKNGSRLAEPGEFSKRAFLNGRIDLSQAEAVMDVIKSQNEYSLRSFVNNLRGDISNKIKAIRESILHDVAFIEAALDDPEHYSLDGFSNEVLQSIKKNKQDLIDMSDSYHEGRVIKEGLNTVIIGKPNVGKSSLLNYLLHEDKAIVTDIPGTTRDVIEYSVNIGKINLNLMDTAGIRYTDDVIEKLGIEKSISSVNNADLIICVLDASRIFDEEDKKLIDLVKDRTCIYILNKCDLENKYYNSLPDKYKNIDMINFSVKSDSGYDLFVKTVEDMFFSNKIDVQNEVYITNLRHVELLKSTIESINMVIEGINNGMSEDFLTIDMMDAYNYLGCIIGETVEDDLVDKIFSEFCMGK